MDSDEEKDVANRDANSEQRKHNDGSKDSDDEMQDNEQISDDDDDDDEFSDQPHSSNNNNNPTTEIFQLVAGHGYKCTAAGTEEIDSLHWARAQLIEKHALGESTLQGGFPIRAASHNSNELFFEVILLYDETQQSDVISEFSEDDRFIDHFQVAFPPQGPPVPWEETRPNKRYVLDNLRVFYRVWGEAKKSHTAPDRPSTLRDPKRQRDNEGRHVSSSSSSNSSIGTPLQYAEVQDLRTLLSSVLSRKNFWIAGHRPIFHVIPKDSTLISTFTAGQSPQTATSRKRR